MASSFRFGLDLGPPYKLWDVHVPGLKKETRSADFWLEVNINPFAWDLFFTKLDSRNPGKHLFSYR